MPNTHEGNRRVRLENIEQVFKALQPNQEGEWYTITEIIQRTDMVAVAWSGLSRATVQRHLATLANSDPPRAEHNGKARWERKWRRI